MIDLNADLGESFGRWRLGDDDAMLEVITSANVACGFHAGDPTTLRDVCAAAVARDVVLGAQVGYRDLAGFGRRFVEVSRRDLTADVLYQVGALDGMARSVGGRVAYVKPHGALYHAGQRDPEQAAAIVDAVLALDRRLPLLCFPGSRLAELAQEADVDVVLEGFVDRAYDDGWLRPRDEPGAVLTDPDDVAAQAVELATGGTVRSLCLHGDTDGAAALAVHVRRALTSAGVDITAFV